MKRLLISILLSSLLLPAMAQEDNFYPVMQKGIQLHEQGYFQDAIGYYQESLALRPWSLLPYYQIACAYACMNQQRDAIKCVERALLYDDLNQPTEKVVYYIEALAMYITLILESKEPEPKSPEL